MEISISLIQSFLTSLCKDLFFFAKNL